MHSHQFCRGWQCTRRRWHELSQAPASPSQQALRTPSDKTAAAVARFLSEHKETELLSSQPQPGPKRLRAGLCGIGLRPNTEGGFAGNPAAPQTQQLSSATALPSALWHSGPQCSVPACPQLGEMKLPRPCPLDSPSPRITKPQHSPWLPNPTALLPFMTLPAPQGCLDPPELSYISPS